MLSKKRITMSEMEIHYRPRSRAQESSAAIQRLYIAMRHLFIRGGYKPLGVSGEAMIEALTTLRPEIYGSITDPERVELDGLLYIFQRLPQGIEECRYIKLISREGFENSHFEPLVPLKRRRNCYRIDYEQMFIEMTRGRSDIYDVLTHLTFLYVEAEKIRNNAQDSRGRTTREWEMLEEIVKREEKGEEFDSEVAYTYLSTLLGRSFVEAREAAIRFEQSPQVNSLFHIAYWLGKRSREEKNPDGKARQITFSSTLRERIGHHIYGEYWADNIKEFLLEKGLINRPIHIISSNLHSVMNALFATKALRKQKLGDDLETLALELSKEKNQHLRDHVQSFAEQNGMYQLADATGTNITVQIFDMERIDPDWLIPSLRPREDAPKPVLFVMDYAFGEQAYETMDELLKPIQEPGSQKFTCMNVASISIMGKAGILRGKKGDIMIPNAHIFEGTADNYPFDNALAVEDFKDTGLEVFAGPMVTVLGTSLQNKEILKFFLNSSWKAIGLEMEGAHYQKAIQAASKIRKNISADITLRYAYYASDNPLLSGHTLASGGLGADGVKPTYLITRRILEQILNPGVE
jgi:hypothetical protein